MCAEIIQGETTAERRRFPRKPLKLQVHCQYVERGNVSSTEKNLAADLGAGGLAMHCAHPLESDQILMVSLYLPLPDKRSNPPDAGAYQEEECTSVAILARVAWSAPAKEGGHHVGVQFLDMDREDRKTLKSFLMDYQLYQPNSFLNY